LNVDVIKLFLGAYRQEYYLNRFSEEHLEKRTIFRYFFCGPEVQIMKVMTKIYENSYFS